MYKATDRERLLNRIISFMRDSSAFEGLLPQFEVNLPTSQMQDLLERTFAGWQVIKHTIVHQKYDIPRENCIANLETDVVTYVVRKDK